MDLFQQRAKKFAPLADRMRPATLDDFVGQKHILGEGKILRQAILKDSLTNCIFFGPPGTGKTTLANIIEHNTKSKFYRLNAVTAGVADVRKIIEQAKNDLELYNLQSYLLLDECHRWSKTQSDSVLPAIEKGIIKFIGSTTENPMISMTSAIISRCRVFEFYALNMQDIMTTIDRCLTDKEFGYGSLNIDFLDDAKQRLAVLSNGDIRCALNALELGIGATTANEDGVIVLTKDVVDQCIQKKAVQCDDTQFYDMLSAFCKSLRGSDPNAAVIWFSRMIYAGVDPRIIVRRLMVHASEDVGLADPQALVQAVSAATALEMIGMPEARIPITQAIIYIATTKKSNSVVAAVSAAFFDAEKNFCEAVPIHLRDNHYKGATKLGYGQGYLYPHDFDNHYVKQQYAPKSMVNKKYYEPSDQGYEQTVLKNMEQREQV